MESRVVGVGGGFSQRFDGNLELDDKESAGGLELGMRR